MPMISVVSSLYLNLVSVISLNVKVAADCTIPQAMYTIVHRTLLLSR